MPRHDHRSRSRDFSSQIVVDIIAICILVPNIPTSFAFVPTLFANLRSHQHHFHFHFRDLSLSTTEVDTLPDTRVGSRPKLIPIARLNEIKDSVDIVSAIESYGLPKFQRRGDKAAVALCPFHDDRSPSLSIDGNRKMFKCFACGVGGNIFKFVQEYNKVQGVEMSFYHAVREVAEKFSDHKVLLETSRPWNFDEEKYNATRAKKEQVLLANTAAALFYAENLINLPAAGRARTHLRSRGLSPTTVKAFSLGYAPDAYFQSKEQRGSGSLVEHLRSLGFSGQDMIDAGLAVRTKHVLDKAVFETVNGAEASESSDDSAIVDYHSLMDRFRERLMVPILDAKGEYVLGFGGRILATPEEEQKSGFKAPKYLNSPESVVFLKKYILFGQQSAKVAIQSLPYHRRSVVIVEGYMDAISLWDAGVCEVVASMGTALSVEQLIAASKLVGGKGGKIILCLDSDDAGVTAVERLCSSNILRAAIDSSEVDVCVASLPEGIKDPSEFVELKRQGNDQVGIEFREKVMAPAEEWTSWYTRSILFSGNASDVRSFGQSFEKVAEFLSTFPNPAERIRRSSDISFILTEIMAQANNSTISTAVRIQLEADLVDMVTRKAAAKESLARRIESVAHSGNVTSTVSLSKLTNGMATEDGGKLSTKALRNAKQGAKIIPPKITPAQLPKTKIAQETRPRSNRRAFQATDRRSKAKEAPHLTEHFAGYRFVNPSDAEWIGQKDRKRQKVKSDIRSGGYGDGEIENVYFNSNAFHGNKLLTDSAMNAGYQQTQTRRDVSIFEKGVTSLIQVDPISLVLAAEDKLLRILIPNQEARAVMKHLLEAKSTASADVALDWSRKEKAWLFSCLVNRVSGNVTVEELHDYLSSLSDSPKGAFGSGLEAPGNMLESGISETIPPSTTSGATALSKFGVFQDDFDELAVETSMVKDIDFDDHEIQKSPELVQKGKDGHMAQHKGCLDYLFTFDDERAVLPVIGSPDQLRIELCVQESLSSLLWALAAKKLAETQKTIPILCPALEPVEDARALPKQSSPESSLAHIMGNEDGFTSSVTDVFNAALKARELHNSAKQMASKLLDISTAGVREGHVSLAQRRAIDAILHEIMDANQALTTADDDNDDESTDDDVEKFLANIDDEYGDFARDDYEWVPGKQSPSNSFTARAPDTTITIFDDDMEESVEEALARMDAEWEGYDDGR